MAVAEPKREGLALLAAVTGHSEDAMRRDWRVVAAGLASLAKISLELIRGYASEDPAVREAAYRRWAELSAMLPKPDPHVPPRSPGLGKPERERLHSALAAVVEALRHAEDDVTTNSRNEAPHIRDRSKP
jgi:hypothetical protein